MTDPQPGKQLSGRADRDPAQFSSWQRVIESLIRVADTTKTMGHISNRAKQIPIGYWEQATRGGSGVTFWVYLVFKQHRLDLDGDARLLGGDSGAVNTAVSARVLIVPWIARHLSRRAVVRGVQIRHRPCLGCQLATTPTELS